MTRTRAIASLRSARPHHVGLAALCIAFLGVGAGCGSDDGGSDPSAKTTTGAGSGSGSGTASGGPQSKIGMIRIVHASPDAPAVDVYAKGSETALLTGLTYGDTSDYLELPPGTYSLELRASPSKASDPIAYATDAMLMDAGDKVTAIAAGLIGSSSDSDRFRVLGLYEGFAPKASGSARVRVVHAGSDAPSVGLDLDNDNPASPEVTGLDRFGDTGAEGLPMTADRANAIGIAAGGGRVTAFTTPELPDGAELFVIATGLTAKLGREADGFALLAVGPDGTIGFVKQDPIVYALHGSPDAPEVDAFVGQAELVDGISFGELAGPVQVPPGEYTLDFFGHTDGSARPSGSPAVSAKTPKLEPGERYLAIAAGFLAPEAGQPGFQIAGYAEGFALDDAASARVRVIHGSPDAPAVDLGVLNAEKVVAPVLVGNVSFGDASDAGGLAISPGTVPLGVAPAGQDSTVVASFHVPATAGLRAFAIAAGALDPTQGQSFRLLAVDTATSPWTVGTVNPQPKN